jgi:hypothetical protein
MPAIVLAAIKRNASLWAGAGTKHFSAIMHDSRFLYPSLLAFFFWLIFNLNYFLLVNEIGKPFAFVSKTIYSHKLQYDYHKNEYISFVLFVG